MSIFLASFKRQNQICSVKDKIDYGSNSNSIQVCKGTLVAEVGIVLIAFITKDRPKNDSEKVKQHCQNVEHKLHHVQPEWE